LDVADRRITGVALTLAGVWAAVFGVLWNQFNLQDELPRCGAGGACAVSLLQYYWTVYEASTLLTVMGVVAAGFGVWFMRGGKRRSRSSSTTEGLAETPLRNA